MRITARGSDLRRAFSIVSDAVPSKPALPVLANVLIVADSEGLFITASSLDITIRTKVDATIGEMGCLTVPAKITREIISEWPDEDIDITSDNESMILTSDAGQYTLQGMLSDDFPEMPEKMDGTVIPIGGSGIDPVVMADMITKTSFAVSQDETRPVLQGVFCRTSEEGVSMVSTDGHRLACYNYPIMGLSDSEAIIPSQCLSAIAKMCNGDGELTINGTNISCAIGDTVLVSRLIEGPYVDYQQIIPQAGENILTVDRDVLQPTLKRVCILSSQHTRQINLSLGATVEMSAISAERGGDAREEIDADYDGKDMTVGYNGQYLQEILKFVSGVISINFTNETTASIIQSSNQEIGDLFYLLMPLRPNAG
jgi:DNA polymerase III subunit beta